MRSNMSILEEEDHCHERRAGGRKRVRNAGRIIAPIAAVFLGIGGVVYAQNGLSRLSKGQQSWVASIHQTDRPVVNTSGHFDTRFAMASFSSPAAIYENPQIITVSLHRTKNGGIASIADSQAIFPGSPEVFALAIAHLTHYDLPSYRTVYSADRSPSDAALGYHLLIQAVSAGILGIGETYLFATNNYGERLPGHAYGFKWNLERSYKNSFQRILGSWYIAPIRYKGAQCSYLRYFNDSVFNEAPPIPLVILQHFTAVDYRELLSAAFQRAAKTDSTKR